MTEQIKEFIQKPQSGQVTFKEVIDFIETLYAHQPTAFKNGNVYNEATQNQGSAKVFYFAQLNQLSASDTLNLFAEHYQSVLNSPDGNDHQNIRQFILHGWNGIQFEGKALQKK